jgi:uncharacterized protein YhjY with autotransporter beta-barrel domain
VKSPCSSSSSHQSRYDQNTTSSPRCYGAIQAASFHPGYSEIDAIATGLALAYASRNAADSRSELGARFDRVLAAVTSNGAVLAPRGRLAWAQDWVTDPTLAVIQSLAGVSFIVNGRSRAQNSVLASVSAELRLANGITLHHAAGQVFDGEYASHSFTYAVTKIEGV